MALPIETSKTRRTKQAKCTITDLDADDTIGGDSDTKLSSKDYTTGNEAWAVYDSTTESPIEALGNRVRFAFTAVYATGGSGPENTGGNFFDTANFSVGGGDCEMQNIMRRNSAV